MGVQFTRDSAVRIAKVVRRIEATAKPIGSGITEYATRQSRYPVGGNWDFGLGIDSLADNGAGIRVFPGAYLTTDSASVSCMPEQTVSYAASLSDGSEHYAQMFMNIDASGPSVYCVSASSLEDFSMVSVGDGFKLLHSMMFLGKNLQHIVPRMTGKGGGGDSLLVASIGASFTGTAAVPYSYNAFIYPRRWDSSGTPASYCEDSASMASGKVYSTMLLTPGTRPYVISKGGHYEVIETQPPSYLDIPSV